MATNHLKFKVRLVVLGVFLLGCVCGAVGMNLYFARTSKSSSRESKSVTERLKRDLNLTSEQTAALEKILENSSGEYHKLYNEIRPRMDAVRQGTRQQIRGLLSPDQQKKFDQITQQIDKKREEERRKGN